MPTTTSTYSLRTSPAGAHSLLSSPSGPAPLLPGPLLLQSPEGALHELGRGPGGLLYALVEAPDRGKVFLGVTVGNELLVVAFADEPDSPDSPDEPSLHCFPLPSPNGAPHPPAVSILPEAAAELGLKALEPPQPYVSAMSSEREVNRRKLALLKNWEFIVAKDQALLDDRARAALLEGLGAKKKARAKPQARGSGSGADAYNATKQGIGAEPEGKGRGREAGAKRKKSAPKEGGVQPSFAV